MCKIAVAYRHQNPAPVYSHYTEAYPVAYRRGWGQGGGHGPRAQALEGAPAQLVGANFKSRGEFQPSKSSIYAMGLCRRPFFFFLFFFFACRFFPQGGGAPILGGGGRRCKHWPPGAGDPRHATGPIPGYPHSTHQNPAPVYSHYTEAYPRQHYTWSPRTAGSLYQAAGN